MTDRHKGYIVVLEENIREDDAAASVLLALRAIRGVMDVRPVVSEAGDAITRGRFQNEIRGKLYEFMRENLSD